MTEKFAPAPHDKYAVGAEEAVRADQKSYEELEIGLKDSFPASDPVSATQPDRSIHDNDDDSLPLQAQDRGRLQILKA